ncbi:hypothetical protein BH20ACI4_BH20ACI4_08120 [soil metagenome]
MHESKFGFDHPPKTDLAIQIAGAVKEWRVSQLEFDRLLAE